MIRIRSMGDCILTTPALAILKRARPDAAIAVVVDQRFRAIFEGNPEISELLDPDWMVLRRWHADLCLNLHGGERSAWMTAISGAPCRAGFAHFRHPWVYNVRIPRAQEILHVDRKVHTAEHLASAMFYLGAPQTEIPQARLFAGQTRSAGRPYAVIHPMAALPEKTWPAERFAEAARYLERSHELEPVFVCGAGEDLSEFGAWRKVVGAPLGEMKTLLAGAALFLGNDSGPAHMAAAFGIPVVVIFGSSDPVVWAPWRTQAEVVTGRGGIQTVAVRDVQDALERLRVRA